MLIYDYVTKEEEIFDIPMIYLKVVGLICDIIVVD
jgi:hypothetical protein